jgi:hypothetical protein
MVRFSLKSKTDGLEGRCQTRQGGGFQFTQPDFDPPFGFFPG